MTRGLSFDQNTHHTGVCEWIDGEFVRAYTLEAGDWLEMALRCEDEILKPPALDWVAAEAVYAGINKRTFGILSRLLGIIEAACYRQGITYYELTTKQVDAPMGLDYTKGKRKEATARLATLNRS